MGTPGLQVRSIRTLDGGADINEVFLDDVHVPIANLVGEENEGWTIAKYLLGHERTNIAGIGMCQRLLTRLKEIARSQMKNGRPLIEDVRFRDRLANLEVEVLSQEWSLMRLISRERAGQPVGTEACMLKVRGSEIQQDLGAMLMDCAGAYALPYVAEALLPDVEAETAGAPLLNSLAAQYFDLRKVSIYGGTNEVQKNLIGKALIGL
jgi:alkylation response protein AidB-like acyl-CoA dehydrogenase